MSERRTSPIGAPSDPVASTPARRAGSVRRTSTMDVGPRNGASWLQEGRVPLALEGAARDLVTESDGTARTHAEARLSAALDGERRLSSLSVTPPLDDPEALVGLPATSGFRGPALQQVEDASSPRGLVLRDLPTLTIISGYASMRSLTQAGVPAGRQIPPGAVDHMADVCSGWRADGLMLRSIAAGEGVPLQAAPEAPALDREDPEGWHAVGPLPPGWMRRRRRVDVHRADERLHVDAMFRDSFVETDGREVALHEYTLTGRFEPAALLVEEVLAEPRVLPFRECPWAADNVQRLEGVPVGELRAAVGDRLAGTAGCTHLNDLLACLDDLWSLVDAAPILTAPSGND